MPRDALTIGRHLTLWVMAVAGLLLGHARDFLALSSRQNTLCALAGSILIVPAVWMFVRNTQPVQDSDHPEYQWIMPASAIGGVGLLLVVRLWHPVPWLTGIFDIAGWLLTLFCWSSGRARWQQLSLFGVLTLALTHGHMSQFVALSNIDWRIWAAILIAWFLISFSAFHWLDKRQRKSPSVELN